MSNHPPKSHRPPLTHLLPWLNQAKLELLDFYQSLGAPLKDLLNEVSQGDHPLSHFASASQPWMQRIQQQSKSSWGIVALALLPVTGLLLWNWKLLLALAVGMAVMALVYRLQDQAWEPVVVGLQRWLRGPQRLLLLCVPSGGLAMLGTYMSANVWDSSHDGWLVAAIVLQGLGLGLGLALLSLQVAAREGDRQHNQLDQALGDLADPNAITRLVAVRQLCRLLDRQALSPEQARMTTQALQLLLVQEPETVVREAVLRGLEPLVLGSMGMNEGMTERTTETAAPSLEETSRY